MKRKGKGRGSKNFPKPWRPVLWIPALAIGLCMLCAKFILWGKISENVITYIPCALWFLIAMFCGFRGAKIAVGKKFLWGMTNAIAYGFMLMIGNVLFFGEPFSQMGMGILWILAGGVIGGILANFKKSKIA